MLLAVQGVYFFLFKARRERTAINRRLALGAQLNNSTEVLEALRRERGSEFLARTPIFHGLNDLLIQSGVRLSGVWLGDGYCAVLLVLYFRVIALGSRH